MSTYYYAVCNKCKEWCNGASRAAGGPCALADSPSTLPGFLVVHGACHTIDVISEHHRQHEEILESDDWVEWTTENKKELLAKAQADGRYHDHH